MGPTDRESHTRADFDDWNRSVRIDRKRRLDTWLRATRRRARRVLRLAFRMLGLALQTSGVAAIAGDAFMAFLLPRGSAKLTAASAVGGALIVVGGLAVRPRWFALLFPLLLLLVSAGGLVLLAVAFAARG